MRNIFSLLLIIGITAMFAGACSKAGTDGTDNQKVEKPEAGTAGAGLIDFIKKQKLVNFQSTTIGNAFESYKYLTKKDWKTKQEGRNFTVSFLGWFEPDMLNKEDKKAGITGKGLEVMFVVDPNGSFYVFMVSKIESGSDGRVTRYQLQDSAGVLSSIYANRKISL